MNERRRRPARVVGLFIAAIALVGVGRLSSPADAVTLLVVTAGGTALAWAGCVFGAAWLNRPPSIRSHIFISTASAAIATATGGWLLARWLFNWEEEIPLLAAALFLVIGAKGMLAGLSLSKQLEQVSASLVTAAKRLSPQDAAELNLDQSSLEVKELARQVDMLAGRLEELRARERALEKSRRELVAGVSHDLRTPLAAVRALVEALEDELVSTEAEVARYHGRIRNEVDRISQLVDGLFELSHIEAGSLQLHFELVAMDDLISEALAQAVPLAEQKGVRWRGRSSSPCPRFDSQSPTSSGCSPTSSTTRSATRRPETGSRWKPVSLRTACGCRSATSAEACPMNTFPICSTPGSTATLAALHTVARDSDWRSFEAWLRRTEVSPRSATRARGAASRFHSHAHPGTSEANHRHAKTTIRRGQVVLATSMSAPSSEARAARVSS